MNRVARILVVEDSQDIADLVEHYLKGAGYETTVTANGSEGLRLARSAPPDAIILDLMLPGLDGLHVCQALRAEAKTSAIPIIMLTARGEETDRIRGLEFGADDYVTKPFSPKELVARVGALLRRVSRPTAPGKVLKHGPLTIDIDKHLVEIDGEHIRLTAKEFLLLQYLIEHRGRVLSRDQLLTDVWSYQYTGGTRTVDVHIRRLREKVPFLSTAIATVKQFGYKLEDPAPST
jgi:DNA-binding response OmpR family regulator